MSNTSPYERQQLEIQQVRAQINLVEQQIAELELECQMNEISLDNVSTIDENTRKKIETKQWILHMLSADLAARERVFAQYLIEIAW